MSHEIRQRIIREGTPEERQRHKEIRGQVEGELLDLKAWARAAAARQQNRVAVGTVFDVQDAHIIQAVDQYAAEHALENRSAVVREALARLLGIEIPRG